MSRKKRLIDIFSVLPFSRNLPAIGEFLFLSLLLCSTFLPFIFLLPLILFAGFKSTFVALRTAINVEQFLGRLFRATLRNRVN